MAASSTEKKQENATETNATTELLAWDREEERVNLPGAELRRGMSLCLHIAGADICSHSTRLSYEPMSPSQQYKTPPLNY